MNKSVTPTSWFKCYSDSHCISVQSQIASLSVHAIQKRDTMELIAAAVLTT